ncbi:MAG: DUF4885 family protein [Bacteroidota bacterium]
MSPNTISNSTNNYFNRINIPDPKIQPIDNGSNGNEKKLTPDMVDTFLNSPVKVKQSFVGYNGKQIFALYRERGRKEFSEKISDLLEKNDIELDVNEKLTFNVDKDCKIQVSGIDDEAKRAKIEAVLNAEENLGFRLQSTIQGVRQFNGNYDAMVYQKWYVNLFLKENAGQSLEDLSLVNGELVGANQKLTGIFNSKIEDVGEDLYRYYRAMEVKVKALKAYGDSKIADLEGSIDFQNGSLIDKNVKYGFGPEQFKAWIYSI